MLTLLFPFGIRRDWLPTHTHSHADVKTASRGRGEGGGGGGNLSANEAAAEWPETKKKLKAGN